MMTPPAPLGAFRDDVYACFTQRRDALFDLVDALLTAETVPSPVHLSLIIVSVCLWHGQHAVAVVAAAARRPEVILCEKLMATSLGAAEQMLVAARRNGVTLPLGHQRRFLPGWNKAKRLVAEGTIGRPVHLWSTVADGLLN